MPGQIGDDEVEEDRQEQVLLREGLEEELMQQDRSEDGTRIPDAESAEADAERAELQRAEEE